MIQGVEHTGIASSDPRKLAEWYVQHLGFVINYSSAENRNCFLKAPDGSMIEIIEAHGQAHPLPDMRAPGLRHIALSVTDFESAYTRLKSAGVTFLTGAPAPSPGTCTAFFIDCDGNILHLIKRDKPLP